MATTITVEQSALDRLAERIEQTRQQLLATLAERGTQLLRQEVPYRTGNLRQGVAPPLVDLQAGTALLTVSARSAKLGVRQAEVIGADGKRRGMVPIRARPEFNYAAAVARGRNAINPKMAKALLIGPIALGPIRGGYLLLDGQRYIVRKRAKATKANPYDQRSAVRLRAESTSIAEAVLKRVFR